MMLDGMSDSIQRSRIEKLHSTEVDRQSPTGLIFFSIIPNYFLHAPLQLYVETATADIHVS